MNKTQDAILVYYEIAAELGSVVTVRVVELTALEPAFDVHPHHTRMP